MDTEDLIERRRLRRRASFWRVVAFVVAIAAVAFFVRQSGVVGGSSDQIARISVEGFIPTRPDAVDLLEQAADTDSVKAIILRIDSPGGAASGGEALYKAVRDAAQKKPVVATIEGLGASAAYMTAIGADHIVARETALTGSIGVILQFATVENLLDKLGVNYVEVKSSPLKGEPTPFEAPSPEALAMVQSVIDSSYDWFVGLVAERRNLQPDVARRLSDGSIFTGRQAVENGLIDAVGGEDEAKAWLSAERNVSADLPLNDWEKDEGTFSGLTTAGAAVVMKALGLEDQFQALLGTLPQRLAVDGLVSVWQGNSSIRSGR
ncbi:signal peptide peptidase SppA [Afifella aestuarii]|uniref:signal peptide peptidase SppA n=1 Tax=Afifella aestuarii TaxID=1909496 RepID=UPI000FE3D799|nr:signal peptide peptidase SppA [Afifella aestuarii]